jgi:hypothetical protein
LVNEFFRVGDKGTYRRDVDGLNADLLLAQGARQFLEGMSLRKGKPFENAKKSLKEKFGIGPVLVSRVISKFRQKPTPNWWDVLNFPVIRPGSIPSGAAASEIAPSAAVDDPVADGGYEDFKEANPFQAPVGSEDYVPLDAPTPLANPNFDAPADSSLVNVPVPSISANDAALMDAFDASNVPELPPIIVAFDNNNRGRKRVKTITSSAAASAAASSETPLFVAPVVAPSIPASTPSLAISGCDLNVLKQACDELSLDRIGQSNVKLNALCRKFGTQAEVIKYLARLRMLIQGVNEQLKLRSLVVDELVLQQALIGRVTQIISLPMLTDQILQNLQIV